MSNAPTPGSFGIRLRDREERTRWANFPAMEIKPTKYVDPKILEKIDISKSFWALAGSAELAYALSGRWSSYRWMMLEFLSTLQVKKAMILRQVQSILFRLRNVEYQLTGNELHGIFMCTGDFYDEHPEYDRDGFWQAIILPVQGESHVYHSQRSKSTRVRNLVFRHFFRALAFGPFARKESGVAQSLELFMLYSVLQGRDTHVGTYIAASLGLAAKKACGTLTCGGMITAIADHVGVDSSSWLEVEGEKFLTYDTLHSMEFLSVNKFGRAFIHQKEGDHLVVPCSELTCVSNFGDRRNWLMNTPIHTWWVEENERWVGRRDSYSWRPGHEPQCTLNLGPNRP